MILESKITGRAVWHATRPATLPLSLAPFLVGAIAGTQAGHGHAGWLAICLTGIVAMHLAANATNEWFDFLSGVDVLARDDPQSLVTTPGVLLSGYGSVQQVRRLSLSLLAIAGICGLSLMLGRSSNLGWIFLSGGLLAFFYTAPPLALAYRGHGLGEAATLLGFGFLPTLAAYQTQTGGLAWQPLILTAPLAGLATALLVEHDYLHWKADLQAGKQTPVVVFGLALTWKLLGGILALTYLSLLANVILGLLPLWVLWLLLTLYPVIYSWWQIRSLATPTHYLKLIEFTSQTHLLFAGVMIVALWIT